MTRTITIKGIGSVSVKPDQVVLTLSLESKDLDYNTAMSVASKQIEQLYLAIEDVGFEKEALKTSNFNVRTSYERVKDKGDNYKNVFDGYVVEHSLKLAFDLEAQRLAEVLSTISACHASPDINIAFTVKNPSEVHDLLLQDAARNAKKKADALIGALGVHLGQLLTVDYNWSEINVFSQTRFEICTFKCNDYNRDFDANITPEDIDINDTVTFVWEIQ